MLKPRQILILVGFLWLGALVLWLGRDDSTVTNVSDAGRPEYSSESSAALKSGSPAGAVTSSKSSQAEIHQIVLPHDDAEFPPGPGRQLFLSRCTVCHTLRYVTMQPDFPEKVWAKEVAKMINTYGAHITGEEARQITSYLASIKGSDGASK